MGLYLVGVILIPMVTLIMIIIDKNLLVSLLNKIQVFLEVIMNFKIYVSKVIITSNRIPKKMFLGYKKKVCSYLVCVIIIYLN